MAMEQEILDKLTALLGRKTLSQVEIANWYAGPVDGGPNGDGLYPLTDGSGFVRMLPSFAKLMQSARSLDEAFAALEIAVKDDVGEKLELIGQAADGSLKRFATDLFPARKTAQLDELHSEEWAESLACFTSTGSERRMAIENVLRAVGNVIDPTHPPYNVVYDYQKALKVTTVPGSNRITTADPVFRPGDVGKMAYVSNGDTTIGALVGYIGAVIDSRNIRIFADKAFTMPKNSNNNQPGWAEMIWGTDCTAGMQAALDAAEPRGSVARGKVVVLGGIVMATELRFGSISIVGLGETGCGFAVLPLQGGQDAFLADKIDGAYSQWRADAYTLRNISIFGQRYTQYYSSFRRSIDIRGGGFEKFVRGAPYAVIDGLDLYEAQWDGGAFYGAFAGRFSNVRAFQNAQCGLRIGFWDLNGQNWHVEGNGGAGILSFLAGANVATVRASYNGSDGGRIWLAGGTWPHEMGSNMTECGYGNTWSNVRQQESFAHNLCISGRDPLGIGSGQGQKNAFFIGTFDDTGNLVPGKGLNPEGLPGVRSMVYIKGNTATNNTVVQVTGAGQVQTENYATNAYWDDGDTSGNLVDIRTPGFGNAVEDWYTGPGVLAATARGPWGTSSSSSIATRRNVVTVNGATAP